MNKENVLQTPPDMVPQGITEEQRTRITQNFRAAKALLARKRPRETLKIPNQSPQDVDANRITSPGPVPSIHRYPLSEIPINTPSRIASKGLRLLKDKRVKSCPGKMLVKNDCDNVNTRTKGAAMEGRVRAPFTCTPTSQSGQSSLSEPLSLSSLLDEAFDESILTEIDALCDKPAAKAEGEESCIGVSVGNQCSESSSGDDQSYLESAAVKKPSDHEEKLDHLESVTEGSGISGIIQCGSMPKPYLDYLQSLNDKQKEAACSDISVPLMIVAGPGSGKTSTMVGRILVLLNEGICPSHILAMTFTTAAASEMRDRIGAVAGKKVAKELTISTFHSFSLQLCRLHAEKLGRTSEFSIYGHAQQRRAIFEAMRLYENERMNRKNHEGHKPGEDFSGINCPQNFQDKSKKWQKIVTQAKASGKTPAEFQEMGDDIGAVILGNYNDILKSCNALDYHDLIICSVKLLTDFPEVFRECQESWNAIVIDEFQDTSSMQYSLLRILASQNCITIVGDEDQSIFSFNGADISGFDSFRENFPNHKEIRLNKNYRSTRCIVEAASSLINNNVKRCQQKQVFTDNSSGSKITVKECHNEVAQCAFVVDKILETTSDGSTAECSFGNIAILYRRQVSGKVFQAAFRSRRIPFNVHGVAFYRKKIIKAILAMLRTTLPGCDDTSFRQVFKALLPCGKEEKKAVIGHIEKISGVRNCSFISTAHDIFTAKVSGTFKRNQLTQGRRVLLTMEMISKLVQREQSISAIITSVANMLPQKYLLEQRAIVDVDSGKLLNEDNDLRSVLQYLLDDVSDFLAVYFSNEEAEKNCIVGEKGCTSVLKAFIDYISTRERENFRSRRRENEDSVTLTTIHQSKGLEWDIVFIVKANESEIPLLHEFKSELSESGSSVEEERRLLYVAMTRARIKLYILYVILDSNWQLLQPSRFLKEIPDNLREAQDDVSKKELQMVPGVFSKDLCQSNVALPSHEESARANSVKTEFPYVQDDEACLKESAELTEACIGNGFLRRFPAEERSIISHLFHQWAKKKAFRDPKRLLNKVGFVVDERLRIKASKNKDLLCSLKSCLRCDEAFQYAEYVLKWEQIPADKRAHLIREKQEHFQKLRMENAMGSSAATVKQIAYLQSLGCTVVPTSRLHASRLIEQYKSI